MSSYGFYLLPMCLSRYMIDLRGTEVKYLRGLNKASTSGKSGSRFSKIVKESGIHKSASSPALGVYLLQYPFRESQCKCSISSTPNGIQNPSCPLSPTEF